MPQVALESLKLIDIDMLVRLVGRDLEGIFSFLANTTYREEVVSKCGDVVEPRLLEEALFQNYAKTFKKLMKNSSKYIKKFFGSLLLKFDALNLKTIFRMVQAGVSAEDILPHIIPLGTYDKEKCQAILSEANSITDIIEVLRDQNFANILKEALKKIKRDDLSPLEAALDKKAFKEILKKIKTLNRTDKKIATNILGIEIDPLNAKIILKYKTLITSPSPKSIKKNLMPTALINEEILESAINEPDLKSILQFFLRSVEKKHQVYQTIFSTLVEESDSPISRLESILGKASLEMSFFELKKNTRYYNIGYILAFLNMKWAEINNLICIINAMARNVSIDQTLDLLILPENYKA